MNVIENYSPVKLYLCVRCGGETDNKRENK